MNEHQARMVKHMKDEGKPVHFGDYRENVPLGTVPPAPATLEEWQAPRCDAGLITPGDEGVTTCTLPPGHGGSHVSHGYRTATSWVQAPEKVQR